MKRRLLLAGVGAAGLGLGTAGCLGLGGGSESIDAPEFDINEDAPGRLVLLDATAPGDITFEDEFTIEALVGNAGGEPVDTEADVRMFHPSSDVPEQTSTVVVEELGSGDVSQLTVGPFDAAYSGTWAFDEAAGFDRSHPDLDASVTVGSRQQSVGDSFDHPSGVRFTVDGVDYERAVHYEMSESAGLFSSNDVVAVQTPASGQVIVHLKLTAENRSSETVVSGGDSAFYDGASISNTRFDLTPADRYEDLTSARVDGDALETLELEAGASGTYYALAVADIESLPELALDVGFSDDESDPEIRFDLGAEPDLPEFELVELDIPSERTEGEQEFGVTVGNVGDAAGTFRGAIQWQDGDTDDWYHLTPPLEAALEPGEDARTLATSDVSPGDVFDYRVLPFGEEFSL